MIAKHIAMRTVKKSDYATLVAYLTDTQSKQARVGAITATNCKSDDTESACLEILNTQALNKRAQSDKTYHLIISFDANDMPDARVLLTIEQRLCESLGFADHQRISVVHHDTDNLHVHVAINKIHPKRYTIHNPHADFKTLGDECTVLERVFDLTRTNHHASKISSENLADDMERQAGVESLLGWIKKECGMQLCAAMTWDEMHKVLQQNGLSLRERGNGFVIQSVDGMAVKASAVDRSLSKAKLESRLGKFQSAEMVLDAPDRAYAKKPIKREEKSDRLFALYMNEQGQHKEAQAAEYQKLRAWREASIQAAKRSGALKRALIKLSDASAIGKKLGHQLISASMQRKLARINDEYLVRRAAIKTAHERNSWADWLRKRASKGDLEALRVLRRQSQDNVERNGLRGIGPVPSYTDSAKWDSITKQGTIILKAGAATVRDDGHRLQVERGATEDGLVAALRLAIDRYGECIHVEGTAHFKDRVVRAAAEAGISVKFDASDLEAKRKVLMRGTVTQPISPADHGTTLASPGVAAAEKYVAELDRKRALGVPSWEHRSAVNLTCAGVYAGCRNVRGQNLALIRCDEIIFVVPVDEVTSKILAQKKIGMNIQLEAGRIQSRGVRL